MIKAKILNEKKLEKRLIKAARDGNTHVLQAIARSALWVEGTAKKKIATGRRTGKIYRRAGKIHQASREGEPPKTDSGHLVASITHYRSKDDSLAYDVAAFASYAKGLEFGTMKVKPRPFLVPSLTENRKKINEAILKALNKAI